ncbi:glycosyltransferase family 2 protein [Gordonia sp. UBA6683]|uniref:glycosyltransferase family 2 protein n=1 Tax=Gordonia sp. UBA6683 TaxID=1946577 RepID=UPI0025C44C64|nr:glycosyltransferase [Gordonia sp. UBA6683]
MKISAVVRCLNEVDHIDRLVFGLRSQTLKVDEIVFVDSGSTDGTLEVIERLGDVIVHIDPSEFSFGRSLNLGIQHASGDLVLICSAHVYPSHDNWVEKLAEPFAKPDVAYVYGRQIGDHRTKFSEVRVMKSWFPPVSSDAQSYPFANNANAMIRRSVWAEREFDETLTGLEDIEWARYVLESDKSLAYSATACVYHVHEESWAKIRNRYRREAIAYKRIFPSSDMSLLSAVSLFVSSVCLDILASVKARQRASLSNIVLFRMNQFIGAWRGFADGLPDAQLLARFYYPRRTGVAAEVPEGRALMYPGWAGKPE